MKRTAIALLTTVGLIFILTLLVLKNVDISQRYFERASKTGMLVQLNKTFLDVLEILKNTEVKDAQTLSFLTGIPIILGEDTEDINIQIDISSAANVFNINNLMPRGGAVNEPMHSFLRSLLIENGVVNSDFFLSILLDALDADKIERVYRSEAALNSEKFVDGTINSKTAFLFLLDYFTGNGGDAKIYGIPWFDIVGFSGGGVDFNYISEPLLFFIKKEYNLASLERSDIIASFDELVLDNEGKRRLQELNISVFEPRIRCKIRVFSGKEQASLEFLYDINAKKVEYFETVF